MKTLTVFNALSRFCDRRGVPEELYSDNQTSFCALSDTLSELYNSIDWKEMEQLTKYGYKQSKGIKWHFNTPLAPHHGGAFEIFVKSAKRALFEVHKGTTLCMDDFQTAVTDTERLINSRPLSIAKPATDDPSPLTPNHFLIGDLSYGLTPPNNCASPLKLGERWRLLQELQNHFWHRWHTEVLPLLHPRRRWRSEQPDVTEGDLALEIDEQAPRGLWRLCKIQEVHPSKDDHIRSVSIKMLNGGKIYKRPITRIVPLDFQ